MLLDYAELQAKRHKLMSMEDWVKKLDNFLEFNEYNVLDHAGKISKKMADELARAEYEKFRKIQDKNYISDYREIKKYLN